MAAVLPGLGRSVGIGGDAAAAAGLELVGHARELAAHGLGEAVGTIPAWWRAYRRAMAVLPQVDAALLVDFPEMNLRLLRHARLSGRPVYYLAPPQAWAWRPWRASALREADGVGCLLPFAADWYAARGVPAEWVGHPLAERPAPPRAEHAALALLPGSRDPTVHRLLPIMLAAVARLGCPAHLAVAPTVDRMRLRRAVAASDLPVRLHDRSEDALAAATVALAGAGTATLEAALAGRPVVTLARMSAGTAAVARRLVHTPHFGLPNLVLDRRAFPERIQGGCDAVGVAADAAPMLAAPGRWDEALGALRARMERRGYAERVTARLRSLVRSGERGRVAARRASGSCPTG